MMAAESEVYAAIEDAKATYSRWRHLMTAEAALKIHRHLLPDIIKACTWEIDDISTIQMIGWALQGDVESDRELRSEAFRLVASGVPLPETLGYYVSCSTASVGKKGLSKTTWRDLFLAAITSRIEQRGFAPYRNRETRDKECACSIVAAATPYTESVVAQARKQFGKRPGIMAVAASEKFSP
jgi:hypothetical protein